MARALSTLKLKEDSSRAEEVASLARCYHEDAQYFYEKAQPLTALISLAYAEGLLDALKMLGLAEFK